MKCPHCNKYLKIKIELDEDQEWVKLIDDLTELNIKAQANWWYLMNKEKLKNETN